MQPTGCRLVLYSHGLISFDFFCTTCRSLNRQNIADVSLAEALTGTGVPTGFEHVPLEVTERMYAPAMSPITVAEALAAEDMTDDFFNGLAARLVARGRADPGAHG